MNTAKTTPSETTERDSYNALTSYPLWVSTLVGRAGDAGTFTTGIETDRRGRGTAINVDVYGYDESQFLAVIQVRECRITKYGNSVRKDYYLLGYTERWTVFAHPIESPCRSRKIQTEPPEATVRRVLARIWDCEEHQLDHIVRQGDVAFVPARLPRGSIEIDNQVTLRDTHKITGKIFRAPDDSLYCERASMRHTKGQHRAVRVSGKIYRIQTGLRAKTWNFSAPTCD